MSGLVPARPETVQRPRLQRLLRYWHDRRLNRSMPSRSDIDPLDMPWILGNLSLVEVHRPAGMPRYRYRLIGSRTAQRLRHDMTGKWLDEMQETEYRDRLFACYAAMMELRQPLVEQLDMLIDDRMHKYEILRLPLSSDGSTIDMMMLAVDFVDPRI